MLSIAHVVDIAKSGLIPHLEGPRGEGKTTFSRDLASSIQKKIRVMNLSAIESTDFCGLPFVDKEGVTRYAIPFWMQDAEVILLDEIDRIRDSAVKSSLLSLLIDKEINGHSLPKDVILMTAGNGASNDKHEYDTVEFDEAMKDRLVIVPFKYSDTQKIDYLRNKYPENPFVRFLEGNKKVFKDFSSRRIESFLRADNHELCKYFLDSETARLFKHFIESNLVTMKDLLKGAYDINNMSAITRSSLVNECIRYFYNVKDEKEATNINTFINSLRPEEASNYFTQLKRVCLEDPEKFKVKSLELNELGMFRGQRAYLKELN